MLLYILGFRKKYIFYILNKIVISHPSRKVDQLCFIQKKINYRLKMKGLHNFHIVYIL